MAWHANSDTGAIDGAAFDALMVDMGPFEASPRIAVAVSGGRDSLALAFLTHRWARSHGGEAIGLTVDHRLRPESRKEAVTVSALLRTWGMEHHTLTWNETPPSGGVQAAARAARYHLMEQWCREEGVLHLALAHHRDDQIETHRMRSARPEGASGGLAGMSAVRETPWVRLLRPLLGVPGERLGATLEAEGIDWIEDPSNRDPRYERVRVRARLDAEGGRDRRAVWRDIDKAGKARIAREEEIAVALAKSVCIASEGYALVDPAILLAMPGETGRAVVGRLASVIGGRTHGPRQARLDALYRRLRQQGGGLRATLAGCRIAPYRDRLLFCREERNIPVIKVAPGVTEVMWDGRFLLALDAPPGSPATVRSLGPAGWKLLLSERPEARESRIPRLARLTLPALWDKWGLLAAPHFGYERGDESGEMRVRFTLVSFRPRISAAPAGFQLVSGGL